MMHVPVASRISVMFLLLFSSIVQASGMVLVVPSLGSLSLGPVLPAIRAAAAGHGLHDLYLFSVLFDLAADENDAVVTGVWGLQPLERGVVRLYRVMWCCVERIAGWYALCVHSL